MRRLFFACATVAACASSAAAQKLRDQLGSLLTFGDWGVPLRVGSVAPDGTVVPNDAFRASAANAEFGSFLVNWMTASASSTPLASTGGGRVFRFAGGVPVEDQPAPGPIFGERATTLGRGAVLAGVNYTGVQFSRVRGVPLDAVRLTLTQNGAAASTADAINVALSLDYQMAVTALFATVGVFDRMDVGVVVPFVRSRLTGQSTANVVAGSAGVSSVVLGGTAAAPLTSSRQNISGRASGIGDVALRAKLNLVDRPAGGVGLVTDLRFPTGDADNLLGSGTFSARALAVYSGRFGALVPYANAGYVYFADSTINNALLATVGADVDMARWATVSLSVLGQRHAGASAYRLPAGDAGRSLTNIPEIRDDALSIAFGTKLAVRNNRLTLNVLAPFTRGGPRPDFAYTVGLERAF
ncbi:hypothetical protein tb265_20540 [Gemmatimonadetes bacterium T265]|nr:hypothetical protein tb265_20540 [Gemmatimonadetes bacterium T265]